MVRKLLPGGTFVEITEEEARRTLGPNWVSRTYPIHPESMPEGQRALLDRMQSAGPGSVELPDGRVVSLDTYDPAVDGVPPGFEAHARQIEEYIAEFGEQHWREVNGRNYA